MGDTAIRRVTTPVGDPAWLATSYADVKALLADPRLGRSHAESERAARVSESALYGGPVNHPLLEGPGHVQFRRLLAPVFSPRRMASLRPLSSVCRRSRWWSERAPYRGHTRGDCG